jgi:hypothetical protein
MDWTSGGGSWRYCIECSGRLQPIDKTWCSGCRIYCIQCSQRLESTDVTWCSECLEATIELSQSMVTESQQVSYQPPVGGYSSSHTTAQLQGQQGYSTQPYSIPIHPNAMVPPPYSEHSSNVFRPTQTQGTYLPYRPAPLQSFLSSTESNSSVTAQGQYDWNTYPTSSTPLHSSLAAPGPAGDATEDETVVEVPCAKGLQGSLLNQPFDPVSNPPSWHLPGYNAATSTPHYLEEEDDGSETPRASQLRIETIAASTRQSSTRNDKQHQSSSGSHSSTHGSSSSRRHSHSSGHHGSSRSSRQSSKHSQH